jgi:thiol-disulfide isomerase/thioredoxin
MKKLFIILLILYFILPVKIYGESNESSDGKIVYFYSTTCHKCTELEPYLESIESEYNLELIKYNTVLPEYGKLLTEYEKEYNVKSADADIIPKIFYKNVYYSGNEEIENNLENQINNNSTGNDTPILNITEDTSDELADKFLNYKLFGIISAGLLNGIAPCSVSMILLFLSIIISMDKNILKLGIAFSLGKFIAFLSMGTILYNFLSYIKLDLFENIFKIVMLIFLFALSLLNLNDFFAAKDEKYDKIKLQLPSKIRKLNNKIISFIKKSKYLILTTFFLSILVSMGEFLCTGQIYLSTIVTIYHTNPEFNMLSLLYLIVYNFSMIIPLLSITVVIYKTSSIFTLSDFVRKNLHIIKLLNIIIYIIIAIIILL